MGGGRQTGAAALIAALAAQGVEYLFGIPGVHTLLPYDLLHQHPTIRAVVTRHEGGAGFAADGYARATGRPGVCLVVPGPGATNLATAALVARSDRVPLVIVAAAVPAALQGRGAIHELDLDALFAPLTKGRVAAAAPGEVFGAVAEAFALARAEPPGPVHLALPYDLFARRGLPGLAVAPSQPALSPAPSFPAEADLERALTLLRGARAPIIYAGNGVVRAGAGAATLALAEAIGAPIITSNKARGVVPEDHPLVAGVPSMAGVAAIARGADLCLALGTRFNEYTTLTWQTPLPARLIRVDHDPAVLGQNYPAEVALPGDLASVLDWFLEYLPERADPAARPLLAKVAALRERRSTALAAFMSEHAADGPPFHPRFVARALREALPPGAIVCSDGSATESWLYEPGFTVLRPATLLVPEIQQTMGYAVGAALGAALGARGRPVVAVVGDGSLAMTLGELATLATEAVPLAVVVFNDGVYNALRVRQEAAHAGRYVGTAIGAADFAAVAGGLGLRALRADSPDALRAGLAEVAAPGGPFLLDVPITPAPLSERYTAVVEAGRH